MDRVGVEPTTSAMLYIYLDIFIFKTSCQQLSFAILMLVYHQERVILLVSIACDAVDIAPICCIKLIVSEVIHPSVILLSMIVLDTNNCSILSVSCLPR